MNKMTRKPRVSYQDASRAMGELMPNIIRGVQLDFFIKRRVTQTQFLMLVAIRAYGQCTMGTLARSLHVRMPTVTGIVHRLVRAGHVRRLSKLEDRRQVLVELTPRGELFFREFEGVVRRRWEEVLRSLNAHELDSFYRVVTKLTTQLQQKPGHA